MGSSVQHLQVSSLGTLLEGSMKNLDFALIAGLFLSIVHLLGDPVSSQWEGWLVVLGTVAVTVLLFRILEGFGKPQKHVVPKPSKHHE